MSETRFALSLLLFSVLNTIPVSSHKIPLQSNDDKEVLQNSCKVATKKNVDLGCSFGHGPYSVASGSQIWLKHVSLSFEVKGENYLALSLQFSNTGTGHLTEKRSVFLEVNDTQGKNYLRRPLTHVDLSLVEPGETRVFAEKLLVTTLVPGDYIISLWIPSAQPEQTYDRMQNFLLSGDGVANPRTRLNDLANLTVLPSSHH
jgi:hypothetical protein